MKVQGDQQSNDTQIFSLDLNLSFLQHISKNKREQKVVPYQSVIAKIKQIKRKLSDLCSIQIEEWVEIQTNKIKTMIRKQPKDLLLRSQDESRKRIIRQHFYILVFICTDLNFKYQNHLIEELIKQHYHNHYGSEILTYFLSAGFDIDQYSLYFPHERKNMLVCCQKENADNMIVIDS